MAPHPDLCDTGCRRHALTWWVRDTDTEPHPDRDGWQLCAVCTRRHEDALRAGGYECWVDEREAVGQARTPAIRTATKGRSS